MNPFVPNAPFLYPLKTSENCESERLRIDLLCKSMDWVLYDTGLRHERVKKRNLDPAEPFHVLIKRFLSGSVKFETSLPTFPPCIDCFETSLN